MTKEWSKQYLGIQHYGNVSDVRRATVDHRVTHTSDPFTLLSCWYRGCGFSPDTYIFRGENSLEDAKKAGELYTNKGVNPEAEAIEL